MHCEKKEAKKIVIFHIVITGISHEAGAQALYAQS